MFLLVISFTLHVTSGQLFYWNNGLIATSFIKGNLPIILQVLGSPNLIFPAKLSEFIDFYEACNTTIGFPTVAWCGTMHALKVIVIELSVPYPCSHLKAPVVILSIQQFPIIYDYLLICLLIFAPARNIELLSDGGSLNGQNVANNLKWFKI